MPTPGNDETILPPNATRTTLNEDGADFKSTSLLNCTSIRIGRVQDPPVSAILNQDDMSLVTWLDYIYLDSVVSFKHSTEQTYDEGNVRHLRDEHTFDIQFVFGSDSYVGSHFEFLRGQTMSKSLTILRDYLTRPGVAFDLRELPTALHNMLGASVSIDDEIPNSNIITDKFNGPRTVSFEIAKTLGADKVIVHWVVKITTSPAVDNPLYASGDSEIQEGGIDARNNRPIIAGELRLDVDNDGDLMIYYGGTVHAHSVSALYKARDYLQLDLYPANFTPEYPANANTPIEDRYGQVNGFQVKKAFNVDKSGRSAKFSLTYTQVKSNSAYPLGIRDIDFDHTAQSTLMSKNLFEGANFRSWKHSFTGRIKIPARMSASYAWYILHMLIQQKLRRANLSITPIHKKERSKVLADASVSDDATSISNNQSVLEDVHGSGEGIFTEPVEQVVNAVPLKYKIKNSHFKRELSFDLSFMVIGSFEEMLKATCFFDRLNNDYGDFVQLHQTDPDVVYQPSTLSEQWVRWQKSVNPAYGYNPEDPNNTGRLDPNFANNNLPNRDNAGTEIYDTGHSFDIRRFRWDQPQQKVILFTTVVDPNDADPSYITEKYLKTAHFPTGSQNKTSVGDYDTDGNIPYANPVSPFSLVAQRDLYDIAPEYSWLKYEQTYEISESNPVIATESVSGLDAEHFSSEAVAKEVLPNEELDDDDEPTGTYLPPTQSFPQPRGRTLAKMYERPIAEEETDGTIVRKTYAAGTNRFYITVRGSAIRVRYKIPIPSILRIAGKPAYRIGKGRIMMKPMGIGGEIPYYIAAWEQTYTFDGTLEDKDILASIETTGAPSLHT